MVFKLFISLIMSNITVQTIAYTQDAMDYSIPIEIEGSLKEASQVLFDADHYPIWTSILELSGNNDFELAKKFKVKFKDTNGKTRSFKAKLIRKGEHSFVAQQKILFGWFLKATHHFVLDETESNTIQFTQHFEIGGLIGNLLRKQIIESLIVFEQLNQDFKNHIEKNYKQ